MNENQINQLTILKVSRDELENDTIKKIDPVMLSEGVQFMNSVAIGIKMWSLSLYDYYNLKYDEIVNDVNKDIEIDINFDEVGMCPHNMSDLSRSMDSSKISIYRISPYIDKPFTDVKINMVDFKRDLKSDTALNKKVTRLPNGRPLKSEYYIGSVLMAVIDFVFEVAPNNLITKRTEFLSYIKLDGAKGLSVKIKEKVYDLTDVGDAALAVNERVSGRRYLVDSVKVYISGVITKYHPDYTQYAIISMVTPYWSSIERDRNLFIDLGLEYWEESLLNIVDPLPAENAWLDYVVNTDGLTIKNYIISTISYD